MHAEDPRRVVCEWLVNQMNRLIFAAFLASAAASAHAADIVTVPDADPQVIAADGSMMAPPATSRWGGAYGGVSGGAGFLWDSLNATGRDKAFGGYIGYNHQFNRFIASAEFAAQNAPITFNDGSGVASKAFYQARLRAGVATDKWMLYGSIGVQHATSNLVLAPGTDPVKNTALQWGGGIEYAVTDRISTGLDYTYAFHENFGKSGIDVKVQMLQARLSYKFN